MSTKSVVTFTASAFLPYVLCARPRSTPALSSIIIWTISGPGISCENVNCFINARNVICLIIRYSTSIMSWGMIQVCILPILLPNLYHPMQPLVLHPYWWRVVSWSMPLMVLPPRLELHQFKGLPVSMFRPYMIPRGNSVWQLSLYKRSPHVTCLSIQFCVTSNGSIWRAYAWPIHTSTVLEKFDLLLGVEIFTEVLHQSLRTGPPGLPVTIELNRVRLGRSRKTWLFVYFPTHYCV